MSVPGKIVREAIKYEQLILELTYKLLAYWFARKNVDETLIYANLVNFVFVSRCP